MKLNTIFTILVVGQLMLGCAGVRKFAPPPPIPDDRSHVPDMPEGTDTHIMWNGFKRQMVQPGADAMDLSRWFRKLTGSSKEAYNVNAFGEVPNSSWFTNRNALERLSLDEVFRGPNTVDGPDMSETLTVVRAKTVGITPGFVIKDARGDRYVIKLDPPGFNELNSGAEVVLTKLLYAAGYNVPENFAVEIDPSLLAVGDEVKFEAADGTKRFMTNNDLEEIISKVQLTEDGNIRAMASKYIPGIPVGPFSFKGTREDDPNDFIPHEHRRELRGMRVIFAWLAHYDTNISNFLDGYVTENGKSYLRHYLIDFGAALGSHPRGAKPADRGSEPYMDPVFMLNRVAEAGVVVRPRDHQAPVEYPAVGRFHNSHFHPKSFKFIFPTRAFEYYTPRDAYWGAKIVMSFTEEQVRAAIEAANYSSQAVEDYLVTTLMERRDIVGRYWFGRMAPIDNFVYENSELRFEDLGVVSGLDASSDIQYRARLFADGKTVTNWTVSDSKKVPATWLQKAKSTDPVQIAIECQRYNSSTHKWSDSVIAYLDKSDDDYTLVGITRDD